ncbi:hypothetical protein EW026_g4731 [Hermanssonia centrifuga]|uniref:Uncharacterized protein n=1 Tax=Hermanssonia centrifuga TaxID=98765 RepID=A0A4S4KG89_9APHY|nr:hypothetical protein EW026_g4731 [Hermanssonia centrifuga]
MQQWETDSSASSVSGSPRSPPTPLDGSAIMPMPPVRSPLRRSQTSPRIPTSPLRAGTSTPPPQRPAVHVSDSELDSYPLRHASAICKATGGGRWEPKPAVQYAGYRIPGSKAQYEIDLERDAEEARIKRANPVIKDGDFQLRVPHELEPHSLGGPYQFSTF